MSLLIRRMVMRLYQIIQVTDDKKEERIFGGFDKETAKKLVKLLNDMTIKYYGHKIEFKFVEEREEK